MNTNFAFVFFFAHGHQSLCIILIKFNFIVFIVKKRNLLLGNIYFYVAKRMNRRESLVIIYEGKFKVMHSINKCRDKVIRIVINYTIMF